MGMLELLDIAIGLTLLFFGRSLFWLFVGLAGYLFGVELARIAVADQPQWIVLLIAVTVGLAGALLAMLAERVAFALGGFYAGAYLGVLVAQFLGSGAHDVLFFVAGGVLGAIFAALIMDWAIILLSTLVGAGAIVMALGLSPVSSGFVYAGLVIAGVWLQAKSAKS